VHTAVKIAPNYEGPVVYVPDASRSVSVASSLLSDEGAARYVEELHADYDRIRTQHANKKATAMVTLALLVFFGLPALGVGMSALGAAIASRPQAQTTFATPNSTTVLDPATLEKLQASMPPAKLAQLFRLCIDDIAKRVGGMREAVAVGDDSNYRRQAHAIKGGCGMVGAAELQTLATSAENDGLPTNHVATFDEFLSALRRLESMLVANGTLEERTAPSR